MKMCPAVFVLAMAIAVANVQTAAVQPYVVPIYRVTQDATTDNTTPTTTATTTTGSPTTTTRTTTVSVETLPTTSQKPTIPAVLDPVANYFKARQMQHPRSLVLADPKAMAGYTFEHVCSGTLVADSAVITTISCIQLATTGTEMKAFVGTAADASSENPLTKTVYEVSNVIKHPAYDITTNANNIAVLKLELPVDFALSDQVKQIQWSLDVPAAEAKCVTSYWGATTPFAQVNKDVVIKACDPVKAGAICSDYTTPPTDCPSGANGASLVCDSKLAGVFTARRNADCSAAMWQYEEISKDATWIEESVGAAAILNVSFAAILALVTVTLKSL